AVPRGPAHRRAPDVPPAADRPRRRTRPRTVTADPAAPAGDPDRRPGAGTRPGGRGDAARPAVPRTGPHRLAGRGSTGVPRRPRRRRRIPDRRHPAAPPPVTPAPFHARAATRQGGRRGASVAPTDPEGGG